MTLPERVVALAAAVGADIKSRLAALVDINAAIVTISPLNAHNVGGVLAGKVYDSAVFVTNQAFTPLATTSGLLLMEPFTTSADLPVFQIGALVGQAFPAGSNMRVGVYRTAANGWPGALMFDSGPIDISPTGFRSVSPVGLTLLQSEPYWLAITVGTVSGTVGQFWGCPIAIAAPLAMINATDVTSMNVAAFPFPSSANPLPNPAPAVSSTTFRSMVFPSVKLVTPS